MDYSRSLQYVLSFADYERASSSRVKYRDFNLQRVRELLRRLGNPQMAYPSVHIAGTKGKGSTVAMVASILAAAGYKAGQYTSPHLHSMRERIAVNGEPISEQDFAQRVVEMRQVLDAVNADPVLGPITTFEVMTVMAFLHFRRAGCNIAVVEVGLGGRLDATNVLMPKVCAITNISLDHTEVLGDTLVKIAEEKAGIIKPGVPVVVSAQQPEALAAIARIAQANNAPLVNAGRDVTVELVKRDIEGQDIRITTPRQTYEVRLPLLGDFQRENAATAVAICETLTGLGAQIKPEAFARGLARVKWPARVEIIARAPLVIVDGAHNPYSVRRLRDTLQSDFTFNNAHLIFGV
jgi:dihydrofolate synthase/folylpolyglutamate synthase